MNIDIWKIHKLNNEHVSLVDMIEMYFKITYGDKHSYMEIKSMVIDFLSLELERCEHDQT